MKDSFSIFVTMIVFVMLIVIFPLYNYFERQDDMSYNLVLKSTTNFIDEIVNTGYISQDMFDDYTSQIANTGNLYNIELEAHRKVLIPTSDGSEYDEQYVIDYNNDIFDSSVISSINSVMSKSLKDGAYKLNVGDKVYIKVENSSTTMAGAMIQAIVPTATTETITINYGGIIKNNTWQQASVPLLDGEDVWLNFDSNGGSSVDSISKKLLAGEKTVQFTIPDAKPTLSNAVFKYWTVDGSAKQYKAGDTIDIGENTTLYANWDYKDITLTYYSEDKKTVVGITAIGYDNSKNGYIVKSNNILSGIDKSGYVFVKWETNKGNTLSNGLKISTDEISCYPVYEQKKININFEYNGATGNKTQTNKEVTVNSNYGTLPAPTKSGYSFEGWYLENSFTNKVTSSTIVTNSSEHTLYAKYVDDIDPTAGTVEMKMATSSGKVAYTSGNWSKNDIVVNLKAGSDLGSGHKSTTYTITNSTKGNTVVSNSSSSVTLKEEGIYNIVVTTKDNAGNTATRNYSAKIDKTAPKFTLEKASTSASDTTINYIISDSLSGMAANQKISTKGIRSSTTDISGNNVEYEEFSFGNTAGVLKFTYSLTFNGINTVEKYYKIFVKGTIYDQAGNSTTINMESKVYTYAK